MSVTFVAPAKNWHYSVHFSIKSLHFYDSLNTFGNSKQPIRSFTIVYLVFTLINNNFCIKKNCQCLPRKEGRKNLIHLKGLLSFDMFVSIILTDLAVDMA